MSPKSAKPMASTRMSCRLKNVCHASNMCVRIATSCHVWPPPARCDLLVIEVSFGARPQSDPLPACDQTGSLAGKAQRSLLNRSVGISFRSCSKFASSVGSTAVTVWVVDERPNWSCATCGETPSTLDRQASRAGCQVVVVDGDRMSSRHRLVCNALGGGARFC